jgi:hypothetical protein
MYRVEGRKDGGVPPGPNFKLIVLLFAVGIFVVIAIAYFVLPGIVGHKTPVNPDNHPTSQIVQPIHSYEA